MRSIAVALLLETIVTIFLTLSFVLARQINPLVKDRSFSTGPGSLVGVQTTLSTKRIHKKFLQLLKVHPKSGKVKEYESANCNSAKNIERQTSKPVKNDRSGLLVLKNLTAYFLSLLRFCCIPMQSRKRAD